jgi:hypothetical protein
MVGSSPSWPAASTPLKPARKTPTEKLSERSIRTLMPSAATVSRSSVPARMRMPRRVCRSSQNNSATEIATTATMKRR